MAHLTDDVEEKWIKKEGRNGIYVSRCVALSVALFNVLLLVVCASLFLQLRGTSVGVEVHRVARQFAGAGPDRQPGVRDPEFGPSTTLSPGAACCLSLDPRDLELICKAAISTAPTSTTTPDPSAPTTKPKRTTPIPTPRLTSSLSSTTTTPATTTTIDEEDDDSAADNLRLPRNLRPFHYDIKWTPDFYNRTPDRFTLNGTVAIYFRCHSPSAVISLNFRNLLIDGSSMTVTRIRDNSTIPLIRLNSDPATEVYNITMTRPLAIGEEIIVNIRFIGFMQSGPVGIYYSQYTASNETRYLVSTQFETTDARRAFPCVDDPAAKATFTLAIDRQIQMKTIANTPLNYTTTNIRNSNWVTDVFQTTRPMSTYLVAFVVSDYSNITVYSNGNNPIKIGLWAQDEYVKAGYLTYSSTVAPLAVNYYANYFNYNYSWPKLDMASIPTMSFGGMENWGMITYQPNRILFDETKSDTEDRTSVAFIISHEILHNWLGNTVTIKWWDDLWLTEGMARYFQYMVIPTSDSIDQLFVDQVFYSGAMWNDDSGSADPVYNPNLETNDDLEDMFSSITYNKGATVIRMIATEIVGEDVFRQALQKYVTDYQYSNVDHSDFLRELTEAYSKSGRTKDFDLAAVVSTWIQQQGFPLVTVKRSQGTASNTITLTQNLFLFPLDATVDDTYPSPFGYLWEIPITYITSYSSIPVKVWMHKDRQINVTLTSSLTSSDWILVNHNLHGYYRVNYDDVNWLTLRAQLRSDHTKIPVNNRAQLIEDSFTLAMSGNLSQAIGFQLTEYLSNELEYLPWEMFHENIAPVLRRVSLDDQLYRRLQNYVRSRLQNAYVHFGWDATANDTFTSTYLRRLILELACSLDDFQCVDAALRRFQLWKADGLNNNRVTPDQRFAVFCSVAARGNHDDWLLMVSRYQATLSHFSAESDKLAEALACTRNITTITSLLQAVQRQETDVVSSRDYYRVVYYIAQKRDNYDVAWQHLNTYGLSTIGRVDMLKAFSSIISTASEAAKFDDYVSRFPAQNDYERDSFETFRTSIRQNMNWRQRNQDDINAWLTGLGFN